LYKKSLEAGSRPAPGYECVAELSGSFACSFWKVRSAADGLKLWQVVDKAAAHQVFEIANTPILLKLRHPHLNPYEKIFDLPDSNLLVLESPLPISDWRKRLAEAKAEGKPGVPWRETLEYVKQAAVAVDFLNAPIHETGKRTVALYHRNLVPDNLMLFRQGAVLICKLANFGLAKVADDDVVRNSRGMSNFEYDPPEFFDGWTSSVSDQFSLAVNYVEMRTGRRPFGGQLLEQLEQRMTDKPNLSLLASPERVVVARALASDPAKRYSSCEEFAEALATIVKAIEKPSTRSPSAAGGSSVFRSQTAEKTATPTPAGAAMTPAGAATPAPATPTQTRLEWPPSRDLQQQPFEFPEARVSPQIAVAIAMAAFSLIAVLAIFWLRRGA
jgi:serine/threonine protein kinase